MDAGRTVDIATPHGTARAHVLGVPHPVGGLVVGHGAGGGPHAPDIQAAAVAARSAGWTVVLTEQPYRVAGRRAPAPAAQLDTAWTAIVAALRTEVLAGMPVVTGGRSSGARVACRTAAATGAVGVLCLAFPLHPPGRAGDPTRSRLPELERPTVPVLVVQGEADPFGVPPDAPGRTVVRLRGTHALRSDLPGLRAAVGAFLLSCAAP